MLDQGGRLVATRRCIAVACVSLFLGGGGCDEGRSRERPNSAFSPEVVTENGVIIVGRANSDPNGLVEESMEDQQGDMEPMPDVDPIVAVSWANEIDSPGTTNEYALSDSILVVLENLSSQSLDLEISMLGDDGSANGTSHVLLGEISLAAQSSDLFPVSFDALNLDLAAQRRSGQVNVAVKARRPGNSSYESAMTTPVYFHPTRLDPPEVLIYGKTTLDAQFGLGDYAGTKALDAEPGVVYDRIIYGGAGVASPEPVNAGDDTSEDTDE
jgi:hypothetical protein